MLKGAWPQDIFRSVFSGILCLLIFFAVFALNAVRDIWIYFYDRPS